MANGEDAVAEEVFGGADPAAAAALVDLWLDLFNTATLPFYWQGYEPERGRGVLEGGVQVDAIGLQSHLHQGVPRRGADPAADYCSPTPPWTRSAAGAHRPG